MSFNPYLDDAYLSNENDLINDNCIYDNNINQIYYDDQEYYENQELYNSIYGDNNDINYNVLKIINKQINEFKKLKLDKELNCIVTNLNNGLDLEVTFNRLMNTCYEDISIEFLIKFPNEYPLISPEIEFTTNIFHLNIDEKGEVLMNIIDNWSPLTSISKMIISVYNILIEPDINYPVSDYVLDLYTNNKDEYFAKVNEYVECVEHCWDF